MTLMKRAGLVAAVTLGLSALGLALLIGGSLGIVAALRQNHRPGFDPGRGPLRLARPDLGVDQEGVRGRPQYSGALAAQDRGERSHAATSAAQAARSRS